MAVTTLSSAAQTRLQIALASKKKGVEVSSAIQGAIAGPALVSDLAPAVLAEVQGILTQSQLQTMFTTPIALIPAPAAGQTIIVDSVEWSYTFATAALTGGGVIQLIYDGSGPSVIEMNKTLITGGASLRRYQKPSVYDLDASTGTGLGVDLVAASAVAVNITNLSAVFAGGNAATTLAYKIRYKILTLI